MYTSFINLFAINLNLRKQERGKIQKIHAKKNLINDVKKDIDENALIRENLFTICLYYD